MKLTAQDFKTAETNSVKFRNWLQSAFPVDESKKVYAEQDGEVFHIVVAWRRKYISSNSDSERICTIPVYPQFDPEFNPETFYKNETHLHK